MNKPNERYPKQVRKWGNKKSMFSVLFPATRAKAVDVRAEKLTEELGHTVSRSMVLDDLVMRDPDLQRIEKQLNKEIADGRKGKEGRTKRG